MRGSTHPRVLVTGAGGFIAHHLVTALKQRGYWVRGCEGWTPVLPQYTVGMPASSSCATSAASTSACWPHAVSTTSTRWRRHGGHGIHLGQPRHDPAEQCADQHPHARGSPCERCFTLSVQLLACVYPDHQQAEANVAPLKEEDAYPASPQDAYGWEQLVAERLCQYYTGEFGLGTRIVRFHNIYGPYGTYDGGREKVPAALCRKVAAVELGGEIEVLGRRLREVLGWEPSVTLRQGLEPTYRWIEKQVLSRRPPWAAAGR